MGLVKKYRNGDKAEKPINKIVYENVGEYNAEDVAKAFTQGLASYADSLGLTGAERQAFMNKGSVMANAIKAGDVTKLANGLYSIKKGYNLGNTLTEKQIQEMKDKGDVGWGAKPYEGTYQRSHGAFTTLGTENLRESNHLLGLIGNYLSKVLDSTSLIGDKKKPSNAPKFELNNILAREFTGSDPLLLDSWYSINGTREKRLTSLQKVLGNLSDEDYELWAELFDDVENADQMREKVLPLQEAITKALANPDDNDAFTDVFNNALQVKLNLDRHLGVVLPKKELSVQEKLLNLLLMLRELVIQEHANELLSEARIQDLIAEKLEDIMKGEVTHWTTKLTNDLAKAWETLNTTYDTDSDANINYADINLKLNSFDNNIDDDRVNYYKLDKFLKEGRPNLDTNNKYAEVISKIIHPAALQLLDVSEAYKIDPNGNELQRNYLAELLALNYLYITKILGNDKINNFANKLTAEHLYKEIKDGPYRGWILLLPTAVNYGSKEKGTLVLDPKVIIFNPNLLDDLKNYPVKSVSRTVVDKDVFDYYYKVKNPVREVTWNASEYVPSQKNGGNMVPKFYFGGTSENENSTNTIPRDLGERQTNKSSNKGTLSGTITIPQALEYIGYNDDQIKEYERILNTMPDDDWTNFDGHYLGQIFREGGWHYDENTPHYDGTELHPVVSKDWDFYPTKWSDWSPEDQARAIGIVADLASLPGGVWGLVAGTGSAVANGYADVQDVLKGRMNPLEAYNNVKFNSALAVANIIPGTGVLKALKGPKYANTLVKLAKWGLGMLIAKGVYDQYESGQIKHSLNNLINGDFTLLDLHLAGLLINSAIFLARGHTFPSKVKNRGLRSPNPDYAMLGNITINSANGKPVTLTHEQYMDLNSGKYGSYDEINNQFKEYQKANNVADDALQDLKRGDTYQWPIGGKWYKPKLEGITKPNTGNAKQPVIKDERKVVGVPRMNAKGELEVRKPYMLQEWFFNGLRPDGKITGFIDNIRNKIKNNNIIRGFNYENLGMPTKVNVDGLDLFKLNGKYYKGVGEPLADGTFARYLEVNIAQPSTPKPAASAGASPSAAASTTGTINVTALKKGVYGRAANQEITKQLRKLETSGLTLSADDFKTLLEYYSKLPSGYTLPKETSEILRKFKILKQGGPLDFARIALYEGGGGISGVKLRFTKWYDTSNAKSVGNRTIDRVLNLLELYKDDPQKASAFVQFLNDMQAAHKALHIKYKNGGNKTIKSPEAEDYLRKYANITSVTGNTDDWNKVAIWDGFDENFTREGRPSSQTNIDLPPAEGTLYSPEGLYSGITDARYLLGRYDSFDDADIAKLTEQFKKLGYDWKLDSTNENGYYKLTKIEPAATTSTEESQTATTETGTTGVAGTQNGNAGTTGNTATAGTTGNATTAGKTTENPDILTLADIPFNIEGKTAMNWGNLSEAARVIFLNSLNTRATKLAMKYRVPLEGLLHRLELLEDNNPNKLYALYLKANLQQQYNLVPSTSDASLNLATSLAASDKGNQYLLAAAKDSAEKFYTTRHNIQTLNNEDLAYNLKVMDRNNAALANKERTDAQLKASNTLENANNLSNLWAGYNQQLFENLSRRQQLFNTYVKSQFANKRAAAALAYAALVKAANGDADLTQKALNDYLARANKTYDEEYNTTLDFLPAGWSWYKIPTRISRARKGSRLTADLLYILESNKDFNRAMRENRKEFHKNVRANNKNRRRKVE